MLVGEAVSNWNAISKELFRWQNLIENSTLTKRIPYSRGTGLLYGDGQAIDAGEETRTPSLTNWDDTQGEADEFNPDREKEPNLSDIHTQVTAFTSATQHKCC